MDGRISVIVEDKTGRKVLLLFYHGREKTIPGVPAGDARTDFRHRKTLYNCFIFFRFQGASSIHQAASRAQVRDGSFDHLTLPCLKHW
jgi:hypothetical protein